MNKRKIDKVVDAIFLIVLALVVSCLLINIMISGNASEAACEPTTEPTTAESIEEITEPTEKEQPATEATEPPITLYDVPLDEDLQIHIIETAEAHNIDPAIIFAMAFYESSYNPSAVGDSGNSLGLLQVQERWHGRRMGRLGVDNLLNPYQNVLVAVDYLAEQIDRYGDLAKGITAYNSGSCTGKITTYAKLVLEKAEELRGETYALYR